HVPACVHRRAAVGRAARPEMVLDGWPLLLEVGEPMTVTDWRLRLATIRATVFWRSYRRAFES
ncbi:MAG: hypothetical protein ACE5E5_15035, partial [Phycisphaerae bacterium]